VHADRNVADIERVKSVAGVGGIDRRDHLGGIDLRRQGKLNEEFSFASALIPRVRPKEISMPSAVASPPPHSR
jgi:hypothetical protein